MSRRRMIAILSAALLLGVVVVVVLVVVSATQTAFGREKVRQLVSAQISTSARGKWHIGKVSGGLFRGFQIDSLEIRDADDSLFVASGPVRFDYDFRDIFDRRVLLRRLEIHRLVLNLTQHSKSEWNFDRLFRKSLTPKAVSLERRFEDFIKAEHMIIHGGTVTLKQPWRPDTLLTGARRDSAIRHNLARTDAQIVRNGDGFSRIRRFENMGLETGLRWAHPDSAGRFFDVKDLDVLSHDPPLNVTNGKGTVLVVSDSVWINAREFSLPGSRGSLAGKVTTGSGLPTRYAISIRGASVALTDVNWVYRPLPLDGGGRVNVEIRNNPDDLRIIEYQLTSLDLRTKDSHLKGAITFGVGGPVLRITDVDLDASPLDFRFVEHMGGKPFPVPWNGQFVGSVRGKGGPVDRFVVEEMAFTFHDANVPLAMSTGTATGELDITRPAETIFRGFDVDFSQLDLRTIEFLFAGFPPVGGTAAGRARLDSLWRDVRFSQSDFRLIRASEPDSRFTGSGRITASSPLMVFDLNLEARPINFGTFTYGYPQFPLRGQMNGPIVAKGKLDQLDLNVAFSGAAGGFTFDGTIDNIAPGYAMRGRGSATDLDLRALLGRKDLPATRLTAALDGGVSGDSLANLRGTANVRGARSSVEGMGIAAAHFGLRFGEGRMYVDSATMRTSAGTLTVPMRGAIGLTSRVSDSLAFTLALDTLSGLPGLIATLSANADGNGGAPLDSLAGRVAVTGTLSGALFDPDLRMTVNGSELSYGTWRSRRTSGVMNIVNLLSRERSGTVTLDLDSATIGGVGFRMASARYTTEKGGKSAFRVEGRTHDGAHAVVTGSSLGTAGVSRIALDTLRLDLASSIWELASPGRLTSTNGGYSIENLELRGPAGARFSASGSLPATGNVDLRFLAEKLPLADLQRMARVRTSFEGNSTIEVGVRGTRESPELNISAVVDSAGIADVRLERVVATMRYSNRRLNADIGLFHDGARAIAIAAQLPMDLRLARVVTRLPEEPISGSITATGVSLGVLEAFFPQLRETAGRFSSSVTLGGTWKEPRLFGPVTVTADKARLKGLGLQLRNLNTRIEFTGDSAIFRRFSAAYEGGAPGDTASLSGHVSFRDYFDPDFDIGFFARNFRVIHLPRVADLYINSRLRLTGSYRSSTLGGVVNVDRGALYIPELAQKRLVALSEIDSALLANRDFTPPVPSALLQNLELRNVRVAVGDQVWLRSAESSASIQLGGEVSMTSVRVPRPGVDRGRATDATRARVDSVYRLALEGTLSADRGDYRMDMGVVQRKFQVEPGGTLSFFGEPELNPTLNISAVHVVRGVTGQDAGRDIRIRVRLTGSLSNYGVSFESVDGLDLSQSDMISYLVTGSPSFELGAAGAENLRTAAAILLPSLVTLFGDRIGGRFDSFQLELALGERNERLGDFGEVFKRTRVGVGKQLGSRTFLSANTNFCQLGGLLEGQSATTEGLIQSIGMKVEQRFNHNFSMALSAEPSTAALRCAAAGSSARGIISSPPQLGFDLFKVWRF